ncbi:MAG: outer-membrane lipoprotein carrier protein LolA [Alloprevotella sp.]|nr:outer-membrane lipoprotein carrier protein LolA [Alloprevotella sp.]
MKKFLLPLLLLACLPTLSAQTAKDILDRTAAKLQQSTGGYSAKFQATSFNGTREAGSTNGTIEVKGQKFKITSNGMTTWFDGHTQWSLLAGSDEVNVSTPSAAEVQQMNPYYLLNAYKQGYTCTIRNADKGGLQRWEVTLSAKRKADFPRILLIIDSNYTLQNIRLRDAKGNWMRFRISGVKTGLNLPDSRFRFEKKDYPGIEVIDLR